MNELVRNIALVKLMVWEPLWHGRITAARARELREARRLRYLGALNLFLGSALSLSMPVVIFAWSVLVDRTALDGPTAFSTLAWLSQMCVCVCARVCLCVCV